MVELDLDIISQKQKTAFKKLTVRENLTNEAKIASLDKLQLGNPEDLKEADKILADYLMTILDLEEEAYNVSLEQFQKLREYLEHQAMYEAK